MIENISNSLIDWSRAQFALTAMYHWIFVPLTLGLGIIQAIMETIYYKTGNEFWKQTAQFWMKLFGINFAIGVATGLIMEFEFGTNWSNYSWFVGDIFGAPLAIEGIVAFFMEATGRIDSKLNDISVEATSEKESVGTLSEAVGDLAENVTNILEDTAVNDKVSEELKQEILKFNVI